jgi:Enoyl-CoA hydratase/isomerase
VVSGYELQLCFAGIIKRLRATDATVIAAVQGVAVGAGMVLTLVADIRFASDQAAFHIVAVRVCITAGECGINYHLSRLNGASRAYEQIEREDSCASVSSSSTGSFLSTAWSWFGVSRHASGICARHSVDAITVTDPRIRYFDLPAWWSGAYARPQSRLGPAAAYSSVIPPNRSSE